MKDKIKIPKDLGIKLGTPTEILWTKVKEGCESVILECENSLIIQREVLQLAEEILSDIKRKFK